MKTAEERSFWTHVKIFEKSGGEVETTGARSAALLSGVWIWQINVTGMIKFMSHWEGKGNSPVAKTEMGKDVESPSLQHFTFL